MKRIVLTSCGPIDNKLKEQFLKLFSKGPNDLKVLFIITALDVENKIIASKCIEEEMDVLLEFGIRKENITEYKIDNNLDIMGYDFIYMIGGNTFYLLKEIRECEFDVKLRNAIENDVVYVGSSAGSIIMGNTIETARDKNKYIDDFMGLKYINGIIIPHANRRKEYIEEQKKKFKDKIYPLYDNHGIIIIDDDIKEY